MSRRPMSLPEFEAAARRRLPRVISDFIDGGAESERTLRANRTAFERYTLSPKLLSSGSRRDQSVTVCGRRLGSPVLLAPTGLCRLAGRGGEAVAARAAEAEGTVAVVSSAASVSVTDVAAATTTPPWFQLYPWGARDLVDALLERASAAGVGTIVVTLDVPVTGSRERDRRNGFTVLLRLTRSSAADVVCHPRWLLGTLLPDYLRADPITMANLVGLHSERKNSAASLAELNLSLLNAEFSWDDLARICTEWQGSVLVKGVLSGTDARKALDVGADGVVVSNHGGRQADPVPAALDVLPEVVAAVGDVTDVLVDGGFRRGSDVVTALALGARAVLVGRPWMHALAVGGQGGVRRMLSVLREEIDRTLALVGARSVAELDRGYLRDACGAPLAATDAIRTAA